MRIAEEINNLVHLLFSTSQSCYILEGDFGTLVFLHQLGTALSNVKDTHGSTTISASTSSTQHKHPEEDNKNQWTERPEEVAKSIIALFVCHITFKISFLLLLFHECV